MTFEDDGKEALFSARLNFRLAYEHAYQYFECPGCTRDFFMDLLDGGPLKNQEVSSLEQNPDENPFNN